MVVTSSKKGAGEVVKSTGDQIYGGERRFDFSDGDTMQCTGDVLSDCTLESCIIFLTNVIPVSLIFKRLLRV